MSNQACFWNPTKDAEGHQRTTGGQRPVAFLPLLGANSKRTAPRLSERRLVLQVFQLQLSQEEILFGELLGRKAGAKL